jgi:hypothetical protein
MIKIYNWSIRKVVFRHCSFYETYLVGYSPTLDTLGMVGIQRFDTQELRINGKDNGPVYILSGQAGLSDEGEAFWAETKRFMRIIYERDITSKYIKN